jgi:HSP20 family protein
MSIELWDPLGEAISLQDAMNSLLQRSFLPPGSLPGRDGTATLPLDISETEDAFVVKASLPGVKPDDVRITIKGDTVTIRGASPAEEQKKGWHWHLRERWFGSFHRSVSLPTPVDSDRAEARYEHGVLTLRLPKAEGAKPRPVKIQGSASTQDGHVAPKP